MTIKYSTQPFADTGSIGPDYIFNTIFDKLPNNVVTLNNLHFSEDMFSDFFKLILGIGFEQIYDDEIIELFRNYSLFNKMFYSKELETIIYTYLFHTKEDNTNNEDIYMYGEDRTSKIIIHTNVINNIKIQEIINYVKEKTKNIPKKSKTCLSYIVKSDHGFELKTSNKINYDELKVGIEFEDCYNDDFINNVNPIILNKLEKNGEAGIILFHGATGTGKTSYLKYLINKVKKTVIYMPPNMSDMLSSPDFLKFLGQMANSIVIIEDAENVLQKREHGNSQGVANLLNASDGLLGDIFDIQFICTFNCSKEEIDPALLRPGRLIAEHEFTILTPDKTNSLVKKLFGEDAVPIKSSMALANIFNMKGILPVSPEKMKTRVGYL